MFKESQLIKSKGFTLIEALVSLALFAIAFSGLYLFFGMAQQANNNSEKKMYLNLMANQILETITAETARSDTDALNPFMTPTAYNADLSDCATYTAPDVRQTWCSELNASVGPHKGVHADEVRTIEVAKDGDDLIVDVALTVDDGSGSTNLVKAYFTRKIRPQRRAGPAEACLERHNKTAALVQSEITKCTAGTIPFIEFKQGRYLPPLFMTTHGMQVSCPDYKIQTSPGLHRLTPYGGALLPYIPEQFRNLWLSWLMETYEESGFVIPADAPTVYGTMYTGGSIWHSKTIGWHQYGLAGLMSIEYIEKLDTGIGDERTGIRSPPHPFCSDLPGRESTRIPGVKCGSAAHVTVVSCCPSGKNAEGIYNSCYTPVVQNTGGYIREDSHPHADMEPWTMTTIIFP